MSENIEIIHTTGYGKISRYKTHTRDPIKEAVQHFNDKYLQNSTIKKELSRDQEDPELNEFFPAVGRTTFSEITNYQV